MKKITFLFLFTLCGMFQQQSFAQQPAASDSLVWHVYVAGKPDIDYLRSSQQVASQWGVKQVLFFGDCSGTYDDKTKALEQLNQPAFAYLEKKYGTDWRKKFNQEVDALHALRFSIK